MDKDDTIAIIRAILSSRKSNLSVSQLNRDFRDETGIDIPQFGYQTISDFLHSLSHTVKLEGIYPIEKVSLIINEKSGHIVSLVRRQRDAEDLSKGLSKTVHQPLRHSPIDKRFQPSVALRKESRKQPANKKEKTIYLENIWENSLKNSSPKEESVSYLKNPSIPKTETTDCVKKSLEPEDGCSGDKNSFSSENKSSGAKISQYQNTCTDCIKKSSPHPSVIRKFMKPHIKRDSRVKKESPRARMYEEYFLKFLQSENGTESDAQGPAPVENKSTDSCKQPTLPGKKDTDYIQESVPNKMEIDSSFQGEAAQPSAAIFKPSILREHSIGVLKHWTHIPHININLYAKTGSYMEIWLSKIFNPHHFYFCLKEFQLVLSKLLEKMTTFYSTNKLAHLPLENVKPGQVCAVYYKKSGSDSMMWQRAEIRGFGMGSQVLVTLIDCGKTVEVLLNAVKYLYKDFGELPRQAILGSLANIRPSSGEKYWPQEATRRFINLSLEKELITRVVSINEEESRVFMTLTCTEDKVHINDVLVEEGYADYGEDDLDVMLSETFSRSLVSVPGASQTRKDEVYRQSDEESEEEEEEEEEGRKIKRKRQRKRKRGRGKGRVHRAL